MEIQKLRGTRLRSLSLMPILLVHYLNEKSFIWRKMARATMKSKAVGSDFKSHFEFSLTLVMQA